MNNQNKIKLPSNKSVGFVFSIFFLILSIYPLIKNDNINVVLLIISLIFFLLGLFKSKILTPLNIIWYKFGISLGKIFSPIVMGFVFFLVVTPTAYYMRLVRGKDLLNLKKDLKKNSYWINKTEKKTSMKNQF
jgi:hypothetical protein|tara:strand:- start:262 stop:660 length:399 start_codon:yes stop_codon:yes gene_type:complete